MGFDPFQFHFTEGKVGKGRKTELELGSRVTLDPLALSHGTRLRPWTVTIRELLVTLPDEPVPCQAKGGSAQSAPFAE